MEVEEEEEEDGLRLDNEERMLDWVWEDDEH